MTEKRMYIILIVFLAVSQIFLAKIKVVSTTSMIADMVKNIGGDKIESYRLMGPGIDPHLYKATTSDMMQIYTAEIIFFNGLHLEGKLSEILEKLDEIGKISKAVSDGLSEEKLISIEGFAGLKDPHIWFDVGIWREAAVNVRETLSEYDSENRAYYLDSWRKYDEKLIDLDTYIREKVEKIPGNLRVLVTAHDAFNYFGKAYGFEVLGLQGISTSSEIGTADIRNLSDIIAERKIKAIFVETSVPKRNIEALKEAVRHKGFEVEIGGELFSDSLGDLGTPEESYTGTFKHNIDTIFNGLMN